MPLSPGALGSVDKPDPDADAAEQDEAQEATGSFIVSCGNSSVLLDMADQVLNA